MEQKQSLFKWLSVVLLDVGFLAYVVYLFCRKPAGMNGTEYEHIGGFIVDTFMIGGAILGLLLPKRFGKLAGFCIVGLSFANLVMTAVEQTGADNWYINYGFEGNYAIIEPRRHAIITNLSVTGMATQAKLYSTSVS